MKEAERRTSVLRELGVLMDPETEMEQERGGTDAFRLVHLRTQGEGEQRR